MTVFREFIGAVQDSVKQGLEYWLKVEAASQPVYVFAQQWAEQFDDQGPAGVGRDYRFVKDKLPFVLVKVTDVNESYLQLGESNFVLDKTIVWQITGLQQVDMSVDRLFSAKRSYGYVEGCLLKKNWFGGQVVEVDRVLQVMRDLMTPLGWRFRYYQDSGLVEVEVRDRFVTIEQDDVFGITPGEYDWSVRLYKGMMLGGNLVITVGAQSIRSRNELMDLIQLWLLSARDRVRNSGLATVPDYSAWWVSGSGRWAESEVPIGGGDMLNMLYIATMAVPVMGNVLDDGVELDKQVEVINETYQVRR